MKKLLLLPFLAAGHLANAQLAIDSTFGENGYLPCTISLGIITTNLGKAQSIAVQSDGKIVAAVNLNDPNNSHLFYTTYRYNPDGTADSTFSGDGMSEVFIGDESNNADVQVQPDGRIICIGTSRYCIGGVCGSQNFVLLRLKPDGTADSTFATNGILESQYVFGPGISSYPNRVILRSTGDYLIGGRGLGGHGFVGLITPAGNLNPAFGQGGLAIDSLPIPLVDMDVDAAGNIYGLMEAYVSGSGDSYSTDTRVVKLLPNGTIDHSFGTDGFANFDLAASEEPQKIRIRPDGRIILAGSHAPTNSFEAYGDSTRGFVMMLEPNGSPVAGVPAGGFTYLIPGDNSLFIRALAVQPDNRILIGGFIQTLTSNFFQKGYVMRLNADATPDATFNSNSTSHFAFDYGLSSTIGSLCGVHAIHRLDNGDVLAAGYRNPKAGSLTSVMITKLKGNGGATGIANPPSFTTSTTLYPNPWHGSLKLNYELPDADRVTVALYDAAGRRVSLLLDGADRATGMQQESFARPAQLVPGIYRLVLSTGSGAQVARSVVVKE